MTVELNDGLKGFEAAKKAGRPLYKIADITLAAHGRIEIELLNDNLV